MFDLTAYLETQRKQKLVGAIKEAAKLIQDCPCPERQWKALRELRVLQERLKSPML